MAQRLADIRERVKRACSRAGRPETEVMLLAVSKTFGGEKIREAAACGQVDFGESRQQEASAKIAELPDHLRWHFIGQLQRNKVRKVLKDFQVIHSVGSQRLAGHIDRIAGELGSRPRVFLEVNLGDEEDKAGFSVMELPDAVREVAAMPHVDLAGLMVIPPASDDPEVTRGWFRRARELRDLHCPGRGLSMGMSGDFEIAIEEGATVVRVGSALFGKRSNLSQ
jgi:pyridoxal phosphate enzyme (YggS family)